MPELKAEFVVTEVKRHSEVVRRAASADASRRRYTAAEKKAPLMDRYPAQEDGIVVIAQNNESKFLDESDCSLKLKFSKDVPIKLRDRITLTIITS